MAYFATVVDNMACSEDLRKVQVYLERKGAVAKDLDAQSPGRPLLRQ